MDKCIHIQSFERFSNVYRLSRNHFGFSEQNIQAMFPSQSPGDAAIFLGSLWVQMPLASWQLHLWMIHLTNRPVFKCICSEEAVVFQIDTLWATDIFTRSKSRQCKNRCLTFIEPSCGSCELRLADILKPMFHTDLLSKKRERERSGGV